MTLLLTSARGRQRMRDRTSLGLSRDLAEPARRRPGCWGGDLASKYCSRPPSLAVFGTGGLLLVVMVVHGAWTDHHVIASHFLCHLRGPQPRHVRRVRDHLRRSSEPPFGPNDVARALVDPLTARRSRCAAWRTGECEMPSSHRSRGWCAGHRCARCRYRAKGRSQGRRRANRRSLTTVRAPLWRRRPSTG